MDVKRLNCDKIFLTGYVENTRRGFFVIGKCWKKLHKKKHDIPNRKNTDFLIGLNDYTQWDTEEGRHPAFDYWAASQVDNLDVIPKGMEGRELPAGTYMVFSFRGRSEDSLQPVVDHVYREWFPQSTCQLDENARYDFARYGEETDGEGKSLIEYWVPVL